MKKKTIFNTVSLFIGIAVIVIITCIYWFNQNKKYLILNNDEIIVEYGQNISNDINVYIDISSLKEKDKEHVLSSSKVEVKTSNEEGKEYPGVGKYDVKITLGKESVIKQVEVKDTVYPEFINFLDTITIQHNAENLFLENYFEAEDTINQEKHKAMISLSTGDLDISSSGEYRIEVNAIDTNNNKTTKECTIIISDTDKLEELTKPIVGDVPTSAKYKQKIIDEEITRKNEEIKNSVIKQNESSKTNSSSSSSTEKQKEPIIELSVPYINQYAYGAPMGCEGAALLQALQGKGYASSVGYKQFLDNMPYTNDENPFNGYVDSPYREAPEELNLFQSIFPSALTPYGSNYGTCINTSGYSTAQLVDQLKKDNPSVVYVTYKFRTPIWKTYSFGNCITNMHVVTLIGYNPNTNQYKVMDPAGQGAYWVNGSTFESTYNQLKMAITVQ